MDDEPMWAADRVVALTPDSAIPIPETANEFAIKGNHLSLVKGNQFDGRTKTDPHKHIHEFLKICDMFKYTDTKNEVVRLMMFPLSLTGEAKTWIDELYEGTIETWDKLQTAFISRFFPPGFFDHLLGEIRAFSQHENESLTNAWLRVKEMLRKCHGHNLSKGNIIKIFYHGLSEITQEVLNAAAGGIFLYKIPNQAYQLLEDKILLKLDWAKNKKTKSSLKKTVAFANEGKSNTDIDKIMARMDAMNIKIDAQYKELQSRAKQPTPDLDDDDMPIIDVIDEILEEDFDALLDEGSKILHFIEGTLIEEEIFSKFNKFMEMTADENYESEFDIEEPPFKSITINTDYKIKTSLEETHTDLKLKPLPNNLEYVFREEPYFLPVIISSKLSTQKKSKLVFVLKKHKEAFAWKMTDIHGICPSFCKHKIQLLDDKKPVVRKQRRLNPNMQEVVKKEIIKLLDTGIIYPIADSPWVSPIHYVLKKGDFLKIARPLTKLLEKDIPFEFDDECQKAFKLLKEKLTCAPVIVSPNWNLSFELMCDASDFAVGAVLADHLSRIENDESSDDSEVDDNFPGETLMEINTRNEPWFADFANYLVADIIPKGMTYQQNNKFFFDLRHYFWE
nr:reverse transcriptase domain-containing protein [Tanacetum cinerariifolium]